MPVHDDGRNICGTDEKRSIRHCNLFSATRRRRFVKMFGTRELSLQVSRTGKAPPFFRARPSERRKLRLCRLLLTLCSRPLIGKRPFLRPGTFVKLLKNLFSTHFSRRISILHTFSFRNIFCPFLKILLLFFNACANENLGNLQ